jgi:CheY-like chemotaxis protein
LSFAYGEYYGRSCRFFNGDGATAMRIIANIRWVDAKAAIIIRYYIRAVLPSRDEIFNSIRSVLVFVKEENRMEVLVVDDSEVVADSLAFLLDCYGHHTTVARDGESALRLLRASVFELVFLDENLPGITGSAVALSIIDMPIMRRPFVVSMTGDSVSYDERARLFDVLLHKPFSIEALMQVIAGAQDSVDATVSLAA